MEIQSDAEKSLTYLPGILWAYQNTPHESTGEKPSFLLFGVDLWSPTVAALLSPQPFEQTTMEDYHEEVVTTLLSVRELAAKSLQKFQQRTKKIYDQKSDKISYLSGDCVLIEFPQEESGKNRKLSQPWLGPFHIVSCGDPDVTAVKVYQPQDGQIQVHQTRVKPRPGVLDSIAMDGRSTVLVIHLSGCCPSTSLVRNLRPLWKIQT